MEETDVACNHPGTTSSAQDLTPLIEACRKAHHFPEPRFGPVDSPVAIGGRLTWERLLSAYSRGIFPWSEENLPNLWWCPDPRCILRTDELRTSNSLQRTLRKPQWRITFDQNFEQVITTCANNKRKGQDGTWITRETINAYTKLHHEGLAHSVECWLDDELVGGLYGVSLGKIFFGESMFHTHRDASKVALHHLVHYCRKHGIMLIDCQVHTQHLESLGATPLPRTLFLRELALLLKFPTLKGRWENSR